MSASRPAPESTGLVPDRSLAPVPLADNGKLVTVAVPPLSLTIVLRRWRAGALSSLVTVQVFVSPRAIVPAQSVLKLAV